MKKRGPLGVTREGSLLISLIGARRRNLSANSLVAYEPVPGRLSAALLDWKALQEGFKGRRIMAPAGIAFAGSQFVFGGIRGAPFSNRFIA
jgi:hypothetical protein